MFSKQSLPQSLLLSMILVITVSCLVIGSLWIVQAYRRFDQEAEAMREQYTEARKREMKQHVDDVVDFVEFKRSQTEQRTRQILRERVEEAHGIASRIYEQYGDSKRLDEIQDLVRETLRSIRFHGGRGYYFATRLDGVEQLFTDRPELEGQNLLDMQDTRGAYVIRDMIELVRDQVEGYYAYTWTKPDAEGREHPKLSFVKHFAPFDWFIGTGEYLEDVEKDLQAEALEWIKQIRYSEEGYVFAGQWDGLALSGPETGKNMIDVTDPNGVKIVQELILRAKENGGFVSYVMPKFEGQRPDPKISYANGVKEWQWYIGTGLYIDDIEDAVAALRKQRMNKMWWNIATVSLVLVLLWLAAYLIVRRMAGKTKSAFAVFSSFFEEAAVGSAEVPPGGLGFPEFEGLAVSANRMVARRREAEQALIESENRYRSLVEQTSDSVFCYEYDPPIPTNAPPEEQIKLLYGGVLAECNDVCARSYGFNNAGEVVGKKLTDLFGTSIGSLDKFFEQFERNGYRMINGEGVEILPDGSKRYFLNNAYGVVENAGLIRVWGTYRDITDRVKSAQEKEKLEKRYRTTVDAFKEVIHLVDAELRILLINEKMRQWCKRLGIEYDIIGKRLPEIFPFLSDKIAEEYLLVLETGRTLATVEEIDLLGHVVVTETTKIPVIEEGEPRAVVTTIVDITDRVRVEKTQAAQLQLIESTTEHSVEELLQMVLAETEVLTGSEVGFYHMLDDDQETISLQTWSTNTLEKMCTAEGTGHHYPVSEAGVWADCVRERIPVIHNDYTSLAHKKGLPVGHPPLIRELVVPVIRRERVVAMLGVGNKGSDYGEEDVKTAQQLADLAWEIAIRRGAEEALRESEARFRELFENMGSGVAIYEAIDNGRDFIFRDINPAGARIGGLKREEHLGRSVIEVYPGVKDFGLFKVFQEVWRSGTPQRYPMFTYEDKRTSLWVENYVCKLPTGEIVAVYDDITEQKQAEQQKLQLEEQYRQAQKMEAVGQLTGGVAHDFNNLLQVINGYTAMAAAEVSPDNPARDFLAEVAAAGERAAGLVSQLLLFSRRQVIQPESVELEEIVTDLLKMLRRIIGEHIQIQWRPGRQLSRIFADRSMIEQVLMNLCVNARDAMPEGGTLTIQTREEVIDEQYCATHSWARPGRYVLLRVSDTGNGMDGETLSHIFEPFFSTKERGKGTGLGLASVYGIIKQHGGMIDVESEPGQGSTFNLYWPLGESQTQPSAAVIEALVPGGGETILLAEDDESVRSLAKLVLEQAGYTVIYASDGAEALALFEERGEEIDIAILDSVMPKMGGRETYDRICEQRPGFAAIFTSGYSEKEMRTNSVLDEASTLIQKPFTRETLLRAVRSTLDQQIS